MESYIRLMTEDDLEEVIAVHTASFQGSINLLAGKNYLREFFRWFTRDNKIAFVLIHQGKIAGYVVGAEMGYDKQINKDLFVYAVTGLFRNPKHLINKKLLSNLLKRIKTVLNPNDITKADAEAEKGKGYSLVGIALRPGYEGKNMAEKLIQAFEQHAKNNGANFLRLSVHKENKRAQRFYEKMIWKRKETDNCYYYYKHLNHL